jgi:hypothetical protein
MGRNVLAVLRLKNMESSQFRHPTGSLCRRDAESAMVFADNCSAFSKSAGSSQ